MAGRPITATAIKAAIAEQMRLADYRLKSLRSELDKAAGLIQAGPPSHTFVVTGAQGEPVTTKAAPRADGNATKAAEAERVAATTTDPTVRRAYQQLAARYRAESK